MQSYYIDSVSSCQAENNGSGITGAMDGVCSPTHAPSTTHGIPRSTPQIAPTGAHTPTHTHATQGGSSLLPIPEISIPTTPRVSFLSCGSGTDVQSGSGTDVHIGKLIRTCLPADESNWEGQLFALAQSLALLDNATARKAVHRWHRLSDLKSSEEQAWQLFQRSRLRVCYPRVFPILAAEANDMPIPPELAHLKRAPQVQRLGCLCKVLARHARQYAHAFFLSNRTAADFLGRIAHQSAGARLLTLQKHGIILEVEKGTYNIGSTFRYPSDDGQFDWADSRFAPPPPMTALDFLNQPTDRKPS